MKMMACDYFNGQLPNELKLKIFVHGDIQDIGRFMRVCECWQAQIQCSLEIWSKMCQKYNLTPISEANSTSRKMITMVYIIVSCHLSNLKYNTF